MSEVKVDTISFLQRFLSTTPNPIYIYYYLGILEFANLTINVGSFFMFGEWYISHLKDVSIFHSQPKFIVTWT